MGHRDRQEDRHPDAVHKHLPPWLLYSPDGKALLFLGRKNYLWNLETKKERIVLEGLDEAALTRMQAVAFDPKGNPFVITAERIGTTASLALWAVGPRRELATSFKVDPPDGFTAVTFSPHCKRIATGNGEGAVRLWDVATGKVTATFEKLPKHAGSARMLAFSPDGKILAAGYLHRVDALNRDDPIPAAVCLYEVSSGKVLANIKGLFAGIDVVFNPDGRTLATVHRGSKIILWSLPERYLERK